MSDQSTPTPEPQGEALGPCYVTLVMSGGRRYEIDMLEGKMRGFKPRSPGDDPPWRTFISIGFALGDHLTVTLLANNKRYRTKQRVVSIYPNPDTAQGLLS